MLIAALIVVGAVAFTIGGLRPWDSADAKSSPERLAQERCQADVLKRLMSPSSAHLTEVLSEASTLDVDGRDRFPLTLEEPLKGVNTSRITVLNVSGVVNAPTELGSTIQDHFDCRAYVVDGSLADTLVLFDHNH